KMGLVRDVVSPKEFPLNSSTTPCPNRSYTMLNPPRMEVLPLPKRLPSRPLVRLGAQAKATRGLRFLKSQFQYPDFPLAGPHQLTCSGVSWFDGIPFAPSCARLPNHCPKLGLGHTCKPLVSHTGEKSE